MRWSRNRQTAPSPVRGAPLSQLRDDGWLQALDRLQIALFRPTSPRPGSRTVAQEAPQGLEVHSHRRYEWGDDLRHLDWNAYARLDEPMVRRFRAEQESATYVLLDASHSMAVASDGEKFRFAQGVAAGLAYLCVRRHEPIQLAAFSSRLPHGCLVSSVWRQKREFLAAVRFLETIEPAGGTALAAAVKRFLAQRVLPGVVFLVSDFFLPLPHLELALRQLRTRRVTAAALQVLAARDWDPLEGEGRWRVRDAEDGGEREVWWSEGTRRLYQDALRRHLEAVRDSCRSHGVTHCTLSVDDGFVRGFLDPLVRAGVLC